MDHDGEARMKALVLERLNGPDGLALRDVPVPVDPARVRIDVIAAGVGFPDLLLTQGLYQTPVDVPFVAGSEVAGIVRDAPDDSGFSPGDQVAAFTTVGGFGEVALADPAMTFPLGPLSFEDGARFLTGYQTAHYAVSGRGRAREGETALVFGAGGGLGTALVDVATGLGVRVIAAATTEEKRQIGLAAGAFAVVDPDTDLRGALRELAPQGVDLVLDPVGGPALDVAVRSLAVGARVVVLGFASGEIPAIAANRLLVRNADALGVVWGAAVATRPALAREIWDDLQRLLVAGLITAPSGPAYDLADGADALRDIAGQRVAGKAVVRVTAST